MTHFVPKGGALVAYGKFLAKLKIIPKWAKHTC